MNLLGKIALGYVAAGVVTTAAFRIHFRDDFRDMPLGDQLRSSLFLIGVWPVTAAYVVTAKTAAERMSP